LEQTFYELGMDQGMVRRSIQTLKVLINHQAWWVTAQSDKNSAYQSLEKLLQDNDVQNFLQVNRYREVLWFNKESFEELLKWLLTVAVLGTIRTSRQDMKILCQKVKEYYQLIRKMQVAEKKSGFQAEKLLSALKQSKSTGAKY